MKPEQTPITSVVTFPTQKFRSFPAEIGSSAPLVPVQPPRRMEFPQEQSITAPEVVVPLVEPEYGSIPAPAPLPETPAD
jgi:hypothetical protein